MNTLLTAALSVKLLAIAELASQPECAGSPAAATGEMARRGADVYACLKRPHAMYEPHVGGTGTSLVKSGRLVARHKYTDGTERWDEYAVDSGALLVRKWRAASSLAVAGEGLWQLEFGEEPSESSRGGSGEMVVAESAAAPFLVNANLPDAWEIKVRNIFYPIETYLLSVDADAQQLVLRTTNKKYFKRISIPALWRANEVLDEGALSMEHRASTLVIRYRKPASIVEAERRELDAVMSAARSAKDGDVACKAQ